MLSLLNAKSIWIEERCQERRKTISIRKWISSSRVKGQPGKWERCIEKAGREWILRTNRSILLGKLTWVMNLPRLVLRHIVKTLETNLLNMTFGISAPMQSRQSVWESLQLVLDPENINWLTCVTKIVKWIKSSKHVVFIQDSSIKYKLH